MSSSQAVVIAIFLLAAFAAGVGFFTGAINTWGRASRLYGLFIMLVVPVLAILILVRNT